MRRTVGVIGGGQLAQMLAVAAQRLDIDLVVQTPAATDPAVAMASGAILAPLDDLEATQKLAACCQIITFENEFVDLPGLATLKSVEFRPRLASLAPLLDKLEQRRFLRDLGLPVPACRPLPLQPNELDPPVVLKRRRHGYDGQGTLIVRTPAELAEALAQIGGQPALAEEWIPFERELAIIAARNTAGEIALFPIAETQQEQQVCRRVLAPAQIPAATSAAIEALTQRILEALQVVGVFGVELFLTGAGQVLINEISPRIHNSGHFSIEACHTSQFEQHLRAICDLGLGDPSMNCAAAVMVNLLGYEQAESDYAQKRAQLAQIPAAQVHWYGKNQSRPGRKLGHVTVRLTDPAQALAVAAQVEASWYGG